LVQKDLYKIFYLICQFPAIFLRILIKGGKGWQGWQGWQGDVLLAMFSKWGILNTADDYAENSSRKK
jgi:hypothetical protein